MENKKKDVNVTETDNVSATTEENATVTEDTVVEETSEIEKDLVKDEPKEEAVKKKKLNKKLVGLIALILVAAIGITAVFISKEKTTKDEKFTITTIKTGISYTKDGEPIDPMELIVVTRAEEETKKNPKEASIADGLTVTTYPEIIDSSVVGDTEVTYTIVDTKNNNYTKKEKVTFTVVNEEAPSFTITCTSKSIVLGKDFDPKTLIKDAGSLKLVEEEPTANEDGTYEYGWYTITSNVKKDKAGTYSVKFHAVGTNGVATDKTVEIKVVEKESSDDKSSSKDTSSSKSESAKKDTSSSKSSSSNKTTTSSSSKSTTSSSTSNGSNSGNTNSSSSSPQNQQTCTEVYHESEGHWEKVVTDQKWVEESPAQSYQDGYECNSCGQFFDNIDAAYEHGEAYQDQGDSSHTFHSHYAFKEATGHYEDVTTDKWVTDKEAYTEKVCQ